MDHIQNHSNTLVVGCIDERYQRCDGTCHGTQCQYFSKALFRAIERAYPISKKLRKPKTPDIHRTEHHQKGLWSDGDPIFRINSGNMTHSIVRMLNDPHQLQSVIATSLDSPQHVLFKLFKRTHRVKFRSCSSDMSLINPTRPKTDLVTATIHIGGNGSLWHPRDRRPVSSIDRRQSFHSSSKLNFVWRLGSAESPSRKSIKGLSRGKGDSDLGDWRRVNNKHKEERKNKTTSVYLHLCSYRYRRLVVSKSRNMDSPV